MGAAGLEPAHGPSPELVYSQPPLPLGCTLPVGGAAIASRFHDWPPERKKGRRGFPGRPSFEPMNGLLLGTPPGQFDAARQVPARNRNLRHLADETHVVAAKRATDRTIARKSGARRCFRYLVEERHDIAKVNVSSKFVKNYFLDTGAD